MTRAALGVADDFANGIIVRQIVELVRAGARNPDLEPSQFADTKVVNDILMVQSTGFL
jgi:hypothetical protein